MEVIQPQIQDVKPSILKRAITMILGLLLLVLFLSYLLLDSSTRLTILGLLTSSKLGNNTLIIDKTSNLVFNNDSLHTLYSIYDSNLEVEFKACLKGNIINNTYYITQTIQPRTLKQEYNLVVAEACPKDTLVDLHTHPFKQCIPSDLDVRNFKRFKENNPDALLAIMCEKGRFYIYR